MWNPKVALTGLTLAGVALAAACTDASPTEPLDPGAGLPLFSSSPRASVGCTTTRLVR